MTGKRTLIYSLLFFCGSLLLFISSANATDPISSPNVTVPCTPVVYAFRHAEDINGVGLTAVGMEHANLYIEMVASFELTQNYCPVKFVYSVDPIKPTGDIGTTNPFLTARPLATILMNLAPITQIGNKRIDEFLEPESNIYIGPEAFREAMLNNTRGGSSVALFWTSQGLHNLGEAIAPGSNIPVKDDPEFGTPPRNAAYVFKYDESSHSFTVVLNPNEYRQCFNWATFRAQGDMSSSKYFCGNTNSNLSELIEKQYLYKLYGRICRTEGLVPLNPAGKDGYYGCCISPPDPTVSVCN